MKIILELKDILTIIATLVSPVIAVLISMWIQDRKEAKQEKYKQKMNILVVLISMRGSISLYEEAKALNMIDIVFNDNETVRAKWKDYYEMLCNQGLDNELGWQQRGKKKLELIFEMAKILGYGSSITHLDIDRVYQPRGIFEQTQKTNEILDELLRVLKSTHSLPINSPQGTSRNE